MSDSVTTVAGYKIPTPLIEEGEKNENESVEISWKQVRDDASVGWPGLCGAERYDAHSLSRPGFSTRGGEEGWH